MQNTGRSTVKMNTNKELSRSEQSAYGAVSGALTGDAAGGVFCMAWTKSRKAP